MIGPKLGVETTFQILDHINMQLMLQVSTMQVQILPFRGSKQATRRWYLPRLKNFKPSYKVQWPPWIPELDVSNRYFNVARGLKKRGSKFDDIEKILGLNWLRYYKEVL